MSTTTLKTLDRISTGKISVDDAIAVIRRAGKIINDADFIGGIGMISAANRNDTVLFRENKFDFLNPF